MNYHGLLGVAAGVVATIAYIPYIVSIQQGKTKPHVVTWLVWTVVGAILAFTYVVLGDRNAIWLPLTYFLGPLVVLVLTIRRGELIWSRFDKACLIVAIFSIIPWVLANDPALTMMINILIEVAGVIPTLIKTYREPESEDFYSWMLFSLACIIELLAITVWNISAVYPVYLTLLSCVVAIMTFKSQVMKQAAR